MAPKHPTILNRDQKRQLVKATGRERGAPRPHPGMTKVHCTVPEDPFRLCLFESRFYVRETDAEKTWTKHYWAEHAEYDAKHREAEDSMDMPSVTVIDPLGNRQQVTAQTITVTLGYDEIVEQLYNLDRKELRRVAFEALLISDGPDHVEGDTMGAAIGVTMFHRRSNPGEVVAFDLRDRNYNWQTGEPMADVVPWKRHRSGDTSHFWRNGGTGPDGTKQDKSKYPR